MGQIVSVPVLAELQGRDRASSQNQQDVPSHRDNKPFIAAGFSMRLPSHELMRGDPFP